MNYVIDKKEVARRIIKETKYFWPHKFLDRQDAWIIAYLRSLNKTPDEIKLIWKPIYLSRELYKDSQEGEKYIDEDFQKAFKRSYGVSFMKTHTIKIYESDIEFLNHLDLSFEIKKFCLIVIAYNRSIGSTRYREKDIALYDEYAGTRRNFGKDYVERKLIDCGFLLGGEPEYYPDTGEWIDSLDYNLNLPEKSGEIVFESRLFCDVVQIFNLLKCFKVCTKCGKVFEVSPRSQKDICDDCWKIQENERWMESKRSNRGFLGNRILICECCGKEFEANSDTKRNICDLCWKEKEKLRIREAVRKRRDSIKM